jgi:hypothetical protein
MLKSCSLSKTDRVPILHQLHWLDSNGAFRDFLSWSEPNTARRVEHCLLRKRTSAPDEFVSM